MLVETVMTSPVISISPSTTIAEAARLMLSHRISGLPVVSEDGALVGMVSEGDFLRRGELGTQQKRSWWLELFSGQGQAAEDYVRAHGRKVGEVMTKGVFTTNREASLEEVVELMSRHGIKRLPVVDNGKLIGIVSRSDLLRALARALPGDDAVVSDDERIREAIVAEIAKQSWGSGGLVRVTVRDGVVELTGTIFDENTRAAARVAAENVPGVKAVNDQIIWVEPVSGTVILPSDRK
ncbi:CBS domain-containing protein [Kaistia nematophila]|uniref:CBS domain-containing protein n=1 Tax=Kaistia nematophila TaxID=2994654 RepID=A0A9X3E1T0_9HYPH|nr:CBS domain-containing protein [Kaistia nematophila]MCX5570176.1 CBS domain-containing protein [Kaistia nematophila]